MTAKVNSFTSEKVFSKYTTFLLTIIGRSVDQGCCSQSGVALEGREKNLLLVHRKIRDCFDAFTYWWIWYIDIDWSRHGQTDTFGMWRPPDSRRSASSGISSESRRSWCGSIGRSTRSSLARAMCAAGNFQDSGAHYCGPPAVGRSVNLAWETPSAPCTTRIHLCNSVLFVQCWRQQNSISTWHPPIEFSRFSFSPFSLCVSLSIFHLSVCVSQ